MWALSMFVSSYRYVATRMDYTWTGGLYLYVDFLQNKPKIQKLKRRWQWKENLKMTLRVGDDASLKVYDKPLLNKEQAKMLGQVQFQAPPNCFWSQECCENSGHNWCFDTDTDLFQSFNVLSLSQPQAFLSLRISIHYHFNMKTWNIKSNMI